MINKEALKEQPHISVLLSEVIETLSPKAGETYVDGTFGRGGYTRAILEKKFCHVVAIDRDPDAIEFAKPFKAEFKDRFNIVEGNFGSMSELLESHKGQIDGVVLDLGISSPQVDDPERGFSFQQEGPLDMRMSRKELSAYDVINSYSEERIANILWELGEERESRRISKAIINHREKSPISTTTQLAQIIHAAKKERPKKIDPATKTFLALRLYVNDELGEVQKGLEAAKKLLKDGGRLVVVTFHGLEDNIVKRFFRKEALPPALPSRHAPQTDRKEEKFSPTFYLPKKKGVEPSREEILRNPRARSARLRWGIFISDNNQDEKVAQ